MKEESGERVEGRGGRDLGYSVRTFVGPIQLISFETFLFISQSTTMTLMQKSSYRPFLTTLDADEVNGS